MKGFSKFLTEDYLVEDVKKGEPPHIEDLPHFFGNDGVVHAADVLNDLHTQLQGKSKEHFTATTAKTIVSQHFDGIPVLFGKHPTAKKFFIAHDPGKPNFSHEDINMNHGDTPALSKRLHTAMVHLSKAVPKRGVYQGDLLYDDDSLIKGKKVHEFTPNGITYKVDANSPDGKTINNSRLGIVVHTKFNNGMQPSPDVDMNEFDHVQGVHFIPGNVKYDPNLYTTKHRAEFTNHFEDAKLKYAKMKPDTLDQMKPHAPYIDHYISHAIRGSAGPDVEDYIKHLGNMAYHEVAKMKKDNAVAAKTKAAPVYQKYANLAHDAQKIKAPLKAAFEMHHALQKAKNTLIDALDKNRAGWTYSINKKKLPGPQGFIVHRDGNDPVRLVNRKTHEKIHSEGKKMMRGEK